LTVAVAKRRAPRGQTKDDAICEGFAREWRSNGWRFNSRRDKKTTMIAMKQLNHLLLAAATVVTLGVAQSALAGEPLLSPRAAQLRYELRKVPSAPSTVDLAKDRPIGNAKAWQLARDLRTVPSAGPTIDLVHAPRPTLSPKDPRFENAWRANAVREFQIAPVK
jgi:hypothetical protein